MALQKPIPTIYGVSASYWRIIQLQADFPSLTASVTVAGYMDKPTKESALVIPDINGSLVERWGAPLRMETLSLPLTSTTIEVNRTMLYEYLKLHPFFQGATDA